MVGIIGKLRLTQRFSLKFSKDLPCFCFSAGQLNSLCQVKKIFCMARVFVSCTKEPYCLVPTLLQDTNPGKIAQGIMIIGKKRQGLLQQRLSVGEMALRDLEMCHLRQDPRPVFTL